MQLILAIDSDRRQADQLATLVRARLTVDLVQATSAGEGLHALKDRVPDLILTSPLLSPFDDGVLDEYLRDLGDAATHVQTLRIPVLSAAPKKPSARSLFTLGRKKRTAASAPDGCDPKLFADEIAQYLARAAEERHAAAAHVAPAQTEPAFTEPVPEAIDLPVEEFSYVPEAASYTSEAVTYSSEPVYVPEPVTYSSHEPDTYSSHEVAAYSEATLESPVLEVPADVEVPVESATAVVPEPVYTVEAAEELPIERPEEPAQIIVAVEAASIAIEAAPTVIEQAPVVAVVPAPDPTPVPAANVQPAPKTRAGISSFEAALAAIRAAWVKTDATPAAAPEPAAPPTTPLVASTEVDLTGEIDALEDVAGGEDNPPAIVEDEPTADEPTAATPARRRTTDKNKKRPEKPRGRKLHGLDGRPVQDEWGIFDPNQCGFSALVNKLDEVTDTEEKAGHLGTTVRVISCR